MAKVRKKPEETVVPPPMNGLEEYRKEQAKLKRARKPSAKVSHPKHRLKPRYVVKEAPTPKTLSRAILNGITAYVEDSNLGLNKEPLEYYIELNVMDFLAQQFTKALLRMRGSSDTKNIFVGLWKNVTGKKL